MFRSAISKQAYQGLGIGRAPPHADHIEPSTESPDCIWPCAFSRRENLTLTLTFTLTLTLTLVPWQRASPTLRRRVTCSTAATSSPRLTTRACRSFRYRPANPTWPQAQPCDLQYSLHLTPSAPSPSRQAGASTASIPNCGRHAAYAQQAPQHSASARGLEASRGSLCHRQQHPTAPSLARRRCIHSCSGTALRRKAGRRRPARSECASHTDMWGLWRSALCATRRAGRARYPKCRAGAQRPRARNDHTPRPTARSRRSSRCGTNEQC